MRSVVLYAGVLAFLGAGLQGISAQSVAADVTKSGAPVAYVYVSTSGQGGNAIRGFSAATGGELSAISGSPFKADVGPIVVNGKYLFGISSDQTSVLAYTMEANGALKLSATTNVETYNGSYCPGISNPVLDHTGATLYGQIDAGGLCDENAYQSFRIDKANGSLVYLGTSSPQTVFRSPLSFIGNDVYAYGASCSYYETGQIGQISGFKRTSSGDLLLGNGGGTPDAPSGDNYCPSLTAADRTNHVAVSVQLFNFNDPFTPLAPPKLAVYTADGAGNLATTSTTANMPKVSVGAVNDMKMAPSGKLLAVAGTSGIQIFHFNGGAPITLQTQLRTTDNISQLYWDNNDHLYALSGPSQLLFVYTITPTHAALVSGAPYSVPGAQSLIVQPK